MKSRGGGLAGVEADVEDITIGIDEAEVAEGGDAGLEGGEIGRGIRGANPGILDGGGDADALDGATDGPFDFEDDGGFFCIAEQGAQGGGVEAGPFEFVVVGPGGRGAAEQGEHGAAGLVHVFEGDAEAGPSEEGRIGVGGEEVAGELEVRLEPRRNGRNGEAGFRSPGDERAGVEVDRGVHAGDAVSKTGPAEARTTERR